MKFILKNIFFVGLLLIPHIVFADIALITSDKSGIEAVSDIEIRAIYLGKQRYIGNIEVKPVHLQTDDNIFHTFLTRVLRMTPRQYKVKWMKNIFSEGISAPEEKKSVLSVISYVKNTKGALGYLHTQDLKDVVGLKVLKTFTEK